MLAVVTGASSGIGYELAAELARRGYDLVIASSGERLESAAENLRAFGRNVREAMVDLATPGGVDALWEQIQQLGRPVDVACINAGVGVGGFFKDTNLQEELRMVNLNCTGAVHLAKYLVQQMAQRNEGRILFTSSIAGEMVVPREAVYGATKAFLLSFAHSLRYELKDTGVTVTALQPGPTDTDFFHRAGMDNTQVGTEGKKESEPDEVARQGLDALFEGRDHVYAASLKTKLEGKMMNAMPGELKGAMHDKMSRPLSEK
jgi:uncharacterized protein